MFQMFNIPNFRTLRLKKNVIATDDGGTPSSYYRQHQDYQYISSRNVSPEITDATLRNKTINTS